MQQVCFEIQGFMRSLILFLNFDGVLHPVGNRTGEEHDFAKLPLLEE